MPQRVPGVVEDVGGSFAGLFGDALGFVRGRGAKGGGLALGLRDEVVGLLFGEAEGVLQLRAEALVARLADLLELLLELVDALRELLGLVGLLRAVVVRLDQLAAKVLKSLLDLFFLVAAKFCSEFSLISGHDVSLWVVGASPGYGKAR
ncbi:hypothetical protein GCM10025867_33930 [Frondihabitans sucicola]|uniref:Uncharacterized protein n=1 Tax=Frondihabitans sucicola TaxID=1268041 RepID=A0ABM8GRR7_9MICO|nr:hypothetical protein [Frondihabitans sucicola]BDZ51152.1 hypothetical protein GCM10025867_33930 [Frondihabitans sucicola]